MPVVTMRQMLEAGVHFGHQTRRWNPKMKRFIYGERNGIYIIDLNQTLSYVDTAYRFVRDLVADGGSILFVGTKKQAQGSVERHARRSHMPYVNERWLGGMLTNFQTIHARVSKMDEIEQELATAEADGMPKKEALGKRRELEKLRRNLGGIRGLRRAPDAIFVVDTKKEQIAVTEAAKLGIPIVAILDTNCDPDLITHPIPGNDDAIRSSELICRVMGDAAEAGFNLAARRSARSAPPAPAAAPPAAPRAAPMFTPTSPPPTAAAPAAPAPAAPAPAAPPASETAEVAPMSPEAEGESAQTPPAQATPDETTNEEVHA